MHLHEQQGNFTGELFFFCRDIATRQHIFGSSIFFLLRLSGEACPAAWLCSRRARFKLRTGALDAVFDQNHYL